MRRPSKNRRRYAERDRLPRALFLFATRCLSLFKQNSRASILMRPLHCAPPRVGKHLVFKTFRVPPPPLPAICFLLFLSRGKFRSRTASANYALAELNDASHVGGYDPTFKCRTVISRNVRIPYLPPPPSPPLPDRKDPFSSQGQGEQPSFCSSAAFRELGEIIFIARPTISISLRRYASELAVERYIDFHIITARVLEIRAGGTRRLC